ncbi:MAG: DUF362 domain-containing protein [Candidatus Hodarchaeota archaeon]
MKIREDKCTGCGQCVTVCTVQAINILNNKAIIDNELCVECDICYRYAECPVKAIKPTRLKWPRIIRSPFSNVIATHKLTGIPGRGTEEMKTNDVTNRFGIDEFGVSIELGRPGVGTWLKNIELFTTKLVQIGVEYEKMSPVTAILADDNVNIKDDIKNERVLSAIIEFKLPKNKIYQVLQVIKEVEKEIDTVFTVGIVSRVMKDGSIPVIDILENQGFKVNPNAKINIGLGKS